MRTSSSTSTRLRNCRSPSFVGYVTTPWPCSTEGVIVSGRSPLRLISVPFAVPLELTQPGVRGPSERPPGLRATAETLPP